MCQKLVVFRPEQTIHEVMEHFIQHRISGGPVVDQSGQLIGIISEADCMRQISDSRYFNMPILDRAVANFMTKEVETIESSKSIFSCLLFSVQTGDFSDGKPTFGGANQQKRCGYCRLKNEKPVWR